ncbi:MAG TPA: PDZ domain-containing protein [Opitutaceae bacterium]|nr:PDZ domain-containing protein [Opitutaceae bacterium]
MVCAAGVSSRAARLCVTAVVCVLGGVALAAAELPFTIADHDGQWKPAAVQKEVAPGLSFEAVIAHTGAPDRFVVFSAPRNDSPVDLAAFAHRITDSFNAYASKLLAESDTRRMGFGGHALRFTLAGAQATFDCELFVFTDEKTCWGVLYSEPHRAPDPAAAARDPFAVLEKKPPGVVALAPFRVKEPPLSRFPISFEVVRDPTGQRVTGIVVTEVPRNSTTEQAGVQVGDAIVAIDGRKVQEFAAGVGKDSELGRIFLNREPGDSVDLEIQPAKGAKPFFVRLTIAKGSIFFDGAR